MPTLNELAKAYVSPEEAKRDTNIREMLDYFAPILKEEAKCGEFSHVVMWDKEITPTFSFTHSELGTVSVLRTRREGEYKIAWW
jgi:hypothetical protein